MNKQYIGRLGKRGLPVLLTACLLISSPDLPAAAEGKLPAAAAVPAVKEETKQPPRAGSLSRLSRLTEAEPYYAAVLQSLQQQRVQPGAAPLTIRAAAPIRQSEPVLRPAAYEGKQEVLLWNTGKPSWAEYEIEVPADALYEIELTYRPVTQYGFRRPVTLHVTVDGKQPFREARSVTLYRKWKDLDLIKQDTDGNDIRPRSLDVSEWAAESLTDSAGAYARPLQWFFAKGKRTLRLETSDAVALEAIRLVPQQPLEAYEQAAQQAPQAKPVQSKGLVLQAESGAVKNDSAIQIASDTDQRTVPLAAGRIVFNSIGGKKWSAQNQELTWTFEIPETGNYKLAFRALQNTLSQKASFRRIRIDGRVPFQELLTYRFDYDTAWKGRVLGSGEGRPYEFYLEKGKHTLSLAVTHDPVKHIILGTEQAVDLLREADQDLKALTGKQSDANRTWHMAEEMPDLPERLSRAAEMIDRLEKDTVQVNGAIDTVSQSYATSADDLRDLLNKVDDIPYRADTIGTVMERIGKNMDTLVQQPLQLDEIYVTPVEQPFPKMEASLFARAKGLVLNFFYSFQPKNHLGEMDDQVLNVWVQRGRDYVTQLQELTDELFTPETGVKVKVNLLPNAQLLVLSNAAGKQPDVALGLSQDLPVDYAIRNSVYDISAFPDFQEMYSRFSPGSWLPFYYNKGYYAVPETQSFQVLYYRKDILDRLGLAIPDTWDEVYDMLPALQQNGMNFYVPPKEFMPYFYQNGAEFFNPDGLTAAMDSPQGFKAFKQWTDLFHIYAADREVTSFLQHFRKGTMPIGVSDYNMYVQLSAAAPELNGSWGIALLPGTKQADGTIARWAGGGQTTGVIFNSSTKKEEAWTFLKWWLSADVQERYGADLEAFNGVAFRWNTSSVEAFAKLPWKREDANIILNQWMWYKDMPNVPGGYYLTREITNAWNRTVVDGMNYRSSLEMAVMDVNRELRRKQQEFGYMDAAGHVTKTMPLPVVNKPWEGVKPYVK
ncbi:extracellular solute-binding protein [Paenibacillus sp. y28]|uniref:extracellular solute-binding protein n=1 Tax=Paenibacillus sp. y28 TaxID=3129110 RepID=UPI00301744CD